jgi:hypothetical protein
VKLSEQFTLIFNGFRAIISGVTFRVTKETLSSTTKIPSHGERWYKGMPLDVLYYEEFIKPSCLNRKIRVGVLSQYLWEDFQKILKVIIRYFTC